MKQYDLTGFQGEVSAFGAYFVFFIFAVVAGLALYSGMYGLALGIFLFALVFYYFLFIKGRRLRRIFFDEQNIYVGAAKIPLVTVTGITDLGVIKYLDNNVAKTLIFINYPIQNPNLELLKAFHRKACGNAPGLLNTHT